MATTPASKSPSRLARLGDSTLTAIEKAGNKLPEPFTLFLILFGFTGVLSTIMAIQGVSVVLPGDEGEEIAIRGLFTGEGLSWLTTTMGQNYLGFPPLVTVLPILLAVGIAERSGMLAALVRYLFGTSPRWVLPYAVGVVGVTASIMADAAFVVIPPLAAMVFKAAGRHPVAGLLGGFAAVGAGYSTALVPTSLDALFAGITTAVMQTLPSLETTPVNAVSNYYFNIASALLLGVIAGFIIDKLLEPRLWKQDVPTEQSAIDESDTNPAQPGGADEDAEELSAELSGKEKRGLVFAGLATVVVTAVILAAVLIPASPWRNDEGNFLPRSPLLSSIVFIIFFYFVVLGLVYGGVVGTVRSMTDVVEMMTQAMKGMLGFLVLAFILGQFIALFAWTGIGSWTAVVGAEFLENIGLTGFGAIVAFIILASLLNLLIISGSSQWTLMAAVFVPMFAILGYEPAFIQAAFRVGDSSTQVITPLNPYMIVILGLLRRYEPNAGLGTLMARLLPFTPVYFIVWTVLLAAWFFLDLPLGPGNGIMIAQ